MIDVTVKYFNCKCKNNSNIFHFLSVQTIEQVYGNATGTGGVLWHREKYWQNQLFTQLFIQFCINSVFKRNQSLKELLAPSPCPNKNVIRTNFITSCKKRSIFKNYLISSNNAVSWVKDNIQWVSFIVIVMSYLFDYV